MEETGDSWVCILASDERCRGQQVCPWELPWQWLSDSESDSPCPAPLAWRIRIRIKIQDPRGAADGLTGLENKKERKN